MNKKRYKDFITLFIKNMKQNKVYDSFTKLKYDYSANEIKYILKNLKIFNKTHDKNIFGNILPKNYYELMGEQTVKIRRGNLEKEIVWQSIILEEFSAKINQFLKYKTIFEKMLFNGQYIKAKEILDEIEENICVSIWSIENRLIIEELSNGVLANKDEFNRITNFKNNKLLKILIQLISTRVEEGMSITKYKDTLNKIIDGQTSIDTIFTYYLDYSNLIGQNYDLQLILYMQNRNSLIDIYMSFINIVNLIILNNENYDLNYNNIQQSVSNLSLMIEDWRLLRINYVLSEDYSVELFEGYEKFIEICDEYTKGNYKTCIDLAKKQFEVCTNSLQYYEIYILSCIFGEIKFINTFPEKSLANNILQNMFNILVKNSDMESSILKLLKISKILGCNEISFQVYGFISKYCLSTEEQLVRNLSEISSYYLSPRFSSIYEINNLKKNFLNKLEESVGNSLTVNFYYDMLNEGNLLNDSYDELRGKIYTANILLENKFYEQAIQKYLSIVENDLNKENKEKYNYLYEKILTKLYDTYMKAEKIENAIELIVDNYLENTGYTYRFNKALLVDLLKNKENCNLEENISLALFYYINDSKDKRNIFAAYDNYLFSKNIERPSEMKKYLDELDINKMIMFLNNICTLDIMEDSFIFESDEDLENERILVCQLLIEIDEYNSEVYMNEIKQITEKIMIRKGIKKVDESKVFVDIAKIKDCLKENMKYTIDRYMKISQMDKKYIEFDLSSLKDIYEGIQIIHFTDGKMNLFKEVFLDVRDYFISSNEYGLDSYLSTRIRHGTLLGQLRKTFEIYNLITSKEAKEDNEYSDNSYWLERLAFLNTEEKVKFNNILREFSKRIDDRIIEVTNVWIKIKTSDKEIEEGRLFDYRITEESYYNYYIELNNIEEYDEFINRVLEILLEITNKNLENIRKKITETLNSNLIKELNDLENNLIQINYGKGGNEKELIKNIAMCRTEIQNEINSISNWFYLNKNLDDNIYTFKELFDISKEILNSSYPNSKKITFNMQINVHQKIKGNEYAYYIDILLILFTNILQRSHLKPEEIKVDIDAYEEKNSIIIKVSNNHNNDESVIMEKVLEARKKICNIDAYSYYNRQEGGTGFVKLEKMLKYNLRVKHNIELSADKDKFGVKIIFQSNKE